MRRRILLANSHAESGGTINITLNDTTEQNKLAYEIMTKEEVADSVGNYDFMPENSDYEFYVSGIAEGIMFDNVNLDAAFRYSYADWFNLRFEGFEDIGIVPMVNLYQDGFCEALDDD